jgi:hypothetical protein
LVEVSTALDQFEAFNTGDEDTWQSRKADCEPDGLHFIVQEIDKLNRSMRQKSI